VEALSELLTDSDAIALVATRLQLGDRPLKGRMQRKFSFRRDDKVGWVHLFDRSKSRAKGRESYCKMTTFGETEGIHPFGFKAADEPDNCQHCWVAFARSIL